MQYEKNADIVIEKEIDNKLVDVWNLYLELEETHPNDKQEFLSSIHNLQRIIGMRKLRRLLPNEYPTYIKKEENK